MKSLVIALLFSVFSYGQTYEFSSIYKSTPEGKELRAVSGKVLMTEDTIIIFANSNNIVLNIEGSIPFYSERETIYRCSDENGNKIIIRWDWEDESMKHVDMYYMPDVGSDKYFMFCLKITE